MAAIGALCTDGIVVKGRTGHAKIKGGAALACLQGSSQGSDWILAAPAAMSNVFLRIRWCHQRDMYGGLQMVAFYILLRQ
jgi:hypothetical protein